MRLLTEEEISDVRYIIDNGDGTSTIGIGKVGFLEVPDKVTGKLAKKRVEVGRAYTDDDGDEKYFVTEAFYNENKAVIEAIGDEK